MRGAAIGLLGCALSSVADAGAQDTRWAVDLQWSVSAGDGDGEGHALSSVRDAALLRDGRLLVLSRGSDDLRVFVSPNEFVEATIRRPRGALQATLQADGVLRRVTREDMAAYDEQMRRERSGSMTLRGMTISGDVRLERFLEDAPRGEHFPLFDRVQIDEDGLVWVREYALASDSATWQVTDAEVGGVVAHVTLPAVWGLLRPGRSEIVVRQRDEYDVEIVRVYPLVPPPGR